MGYVARLFRRLGNRPREQRRELRTRELPLDCSAKEFQKQENQRNHRRLRGKQVLGGVGRRQEVRCEQTIAVASNSQRLESRDGNLSPPKPKGRVCMTDSEILVEAFKRGRSWNPAYPNLLNADEAAI